MGYRIPLFIACAVFLSMASFKGNFVATTQDCLLQTMTESKDAPESKKKMSLVDLTDYNGPQTTYEPWSLEKRAFPCVSADAHWKTVKVQRSPAKTGLLYVREMKTGSSTMAGVILRLSHRKGKQLLDDADDGPCRMRIDHSSATRLQYKDRNKKRSFLISLLREPTKRAISQYFHFRVSEKKEDPIDENFQNYFFDDPLHRSNYYTKDLAMGPVDLENGENKEEIVQSIIDEYNFIAITERMDESLVVMKMLLGLDFEDILYMSAKTHGSFTTAATEEGNGCIYIIPSFLSDGMKEFFASQYWQEYMAYDNLLYKAAVKSLDNTIDALGRQVVEAQLRLFRRAQAIAHDKCAARTVYRCNNKGEFVGSTNSTCYMWDIGCGFDCLNELSLDDMGID